MESDGYLPYAPEHVGRAIEGPPMIGWSVQIFLCGICLQKALPHFAKASPVSRQVKWLLAYATVWNIFLSLTCMWGIFWWGSTQKRSEDQLWSYTIGEALSPLCMAMVSGPVQAYFAHRAWMVLGRNKIFAVAVCLLIMVSSSGNIGYTIIAIQNGSYDLMFLFTMLYNWTSVLVDIMVTIVLTIGLYRQRTGFDTKADTAVTKLMRLAFETASMTAIWMLASALTFILTLPTLYRNAFLALAFPMSSIYVFSMLYTLDRLNSVRDLMAVHDLSTPTGADAEAARVMVLPVLPRIRSQVSESDMVQLSYRDMLGGTQPYPTPSGEGSSSESLGFKISQNENKSV